MRTSEPDGERLLLDINVIAITVLSDHPGHEYMFPHVQRGFTGETVLLVFDYFPLRAQYVLTTWYRVDEHRARNAVQDSSANRCRSSQLTVRHSSTPTK